ncbi:threonine synthase [Buchnera aphidicola]|uniref:threonine synthase n=1 Tax=Buchnera aphidicola TaxID=9 RepID=UPI0022387598|nr:threonine synthase [Buchnera aphidicola]MCW5197730.1 threonine synthase [Buchnera aphidicola (Chaitophorus viminalis)]
MKLYNLKDKKEIVNFSEAVKYGLGKNQGLFFPKKLPIFSQKKIQKLLNKKFISRSQEILSILIGSEIKKKKIKDSVQSAFNFSGPKIVNITNNIYCMELFHGPTLAFKDYGARFMAQILSCLNNQENKSITILTATSGDTGAAVAHAFYKMKNVKVIILYPKGKISKIQKKLFCTLGKNITTISVNGSFDECQKLVKQAFHDQEIRKNTQLNSANSINVSRLFAQICYFFEIFYLLPENLQNKLVISIPCGNFGNLTAGLLAKSMGLPIKKFILATNSNNTVPRYLETGIWNPYKTISTISNAMDISQPNNWPRVEEIFYEKKWNIKDLKYGYVSENETKKNIKNLYMKYKYISEPHASIAYTVLKKKLKIDEHGIFLGTAHPIKFQNTVEQILNIKLKIKQNISNILHLKNLSYNIEPNFKILKKILLKN